MKVRVWIEQEVEATVTVEEAITEPLAMPETNDRPSLVMVLNRCVSALRNVPDGVIEALQPATRKVVADALRQQLARYERTEE